MKPENRDRIRIAYVVHSFAAGGLEHCVARLTNHLDRSRFHPSVISMTTSGAAEKWIESDDVSIVELRKPLGNHPGIVAKLARELRRQKVDIVHSHCWGTLVESLIAGKWARVGAHVHAERGTLIDELNMEGWRCALRAKVMNLTMRQVDAVISVAEVTGDRIAQWCGYPREMIQVIPNGVDAPDVGERETERQRIRASLGIGESSVLLGTLGRLEPVKGYDNLVASIQRAVVAGEDVHLLLVGDGPERGALADQIHRLGLTGRVHLVGYQQDVGPWLGATDVYVNSSVSEGVSQAVLEAMSLGLPCLVTDVGDHATVVGGVDPAGMVVPASDPVAMAQAVQHLATNSLQREQFSRNAQQRFRDRFDILPMVRQYEDLYLSLVDGGRRPPSRAVSTDVAEAASVSEQAIVPMAGRRA